MHNIFPPMTVPYSCPSLPSMVTTQPTLPPNPTTDNEEIPPTTTRQPQEPVDPQTTTSISPTSTDSTVDIITSTGAESSNLRPATSMPIDGTGPEIIEPNTSMSTNGDSGSNSTITESGKLHMLLILFSNLQLYGTTGSSVPVDLTIGLSIFCTVLMIVIITTFVSVHGGVLESEKDCECIISQFSHTNKQGLWNCPSELSNDFFRHVSEYLHVLHV